MKSVFFIIHTMAWLLLFVSTTQANEQSVYQNSLNQDNSNPNFSNLSSDQGNNLTGQTNGPASGQTSNQASNQAGNDAGFVQNNEFSNNQRPEHSGDHSGEHADGNAEKHDFPPAVEAFHDVMAPLWHAPAGEQRAQEICVQSSQLVANVGIIQQSETPINIKASEWNQAVTNLTQAVTELEQQCDDKNSPEPALGEVHEAFHHLVKLLEHKQATSAMNTGVNSGVTSDLDSNTKSDSNSGIATGVGAGTKAITTPADDEIDYEKVSDAFAECSALQNTLASLISNNQQEFENHTLHHAANDALIVASDFAQAGGLDEGIVKTQYDFHYAKFQDMLNASTTDNELFAEKAKPIIDKCASLNDIQTQLISERQKQNEQPEDYLPAEY